MSETHEDSFIFYRSFYEAMEGQSDADRLALYDAIARLALNGEKAELPPAPRGLFTLIIPQIEANRKKRACGRRGGRPPREKTNGYEDEKTIGYEKKKPNVNENENANENENGNGNGNENADIISAGKPRRFQPPTLAEVRDYCRERGNNVDASRFIDYYSSNGWKVGRNPMKDWRAAVRTWEKSGGGYGQENTDRYANLRRLYEDTPDD